MIGKMKSSIHIFCILASIIFLCSYTYNGFSGQKDITVDTSPTNLRQGATFDFPAMDKKIEELRLKYDLPGVTVAVVRNGSLVYINCYGFQDEEKQIPATNTNLFRIASISKPITVTALLKLMQEGKLSMDSKVFGSSGILGEDFGKLPVNSDWNKITIRHLIEHKSGIFNIPDDPMFSYKGLDKYEVIKRVISERPLQNKPGEQYYYSNVGYNILGRVIEKVTGQKYEEYFKTNILEPCGINRMEVAGNTLSERYPDEIIYTQPDEPGWPYGMDVSRMDSHGGWIASAVDLARFVAHIDRNTATPDIINSKWLNQTYMGYLQWQHSGSLPGTATWLARMNDEFSYVFLTNRRSDIKEFWSDIPAYMQSAIEAQESWPDIDLFQKITW